MRKNNYLIAILLISMVCNVTFAQTILNNSVSVIKSSAKWQKIKEGHDIFIDNSYNYQNQINVLNMQFPARINFLNPITLDGISGIKSVYLVYDFRCDPMEYRATYREIFSDKDLSGTLLNSTDRFGTRMERVINKEDTEEMIINHACSWVKEKSDAFKRQQEREAQRKWLETPEGRKHLAEEAIKEKKAEQDRLKAEMALKERMNREFPFYALITCGVGAAHIHITACIRSDYGSLEVRNGNDYGMYKIFQVMNLQVPNAKETREGYVIDLRRNFEIVARNGEEKNVIMGVKIIDRTSQKVVFQKQTDRFGTIRVGN
jgi:hypothetical protein